MIIIIIIIILCDVICSIQQLLVDTIAVFVESAEPSLINTKRVLLITTGLYINTSLNRNFGRGRHDIILMTITRITVKKYPYMVALYLNIIRYYIMYIII